MMIMKSNAIINSNMQILIGRFEAPKIFHVSCDANSFTACQQFL